MLEVLLVVFLVLKLEHEVTWSWWWVLAPLWIPSLVLAGELLVIVAQAKRGGR